MDLRQRAIFKVDNAIKKFNDATFARQNLD